MQVSVESGEGLERRMTVELPAEQMSNEVNKRLQHIARTAKMDGFRPGKVPLNMVRSRYAGQIQQEVFGELVQSSFYEAVANEKLKPAGLPKIEPIEKEEGQDDSMRYLAVFEVMPEVQLAKIEGVTVKRPVATITDEDVDGMIEKLRKQRVTWNSVERASADDDQVKISFKGSIDNEPFEGGEGSDYPLVLGSGSMIEGFETGLVGALAGDSRTLDLKFPEEYHAKNLAGKDVQFEVEVQEVAEAVLPELSDEFAKEFGVAEGGMDKLLKDIRDNMERELSDRVKAKIKGQAMDALIDANPIDVPTALVDEEIESLRKQAQQRIPGGADSQFELPRELFEEQAKKRVALGLIIAEVVKSEKIELDSDRVQETIADFASSYEDPDDVVKYYNSNRDQMVAVESAVLEDQVVDWILDNVSVEDEATDFSTLSGPSE